MLNRRLIVLLTALCCLAVITIVVVADQSFGPQVFAFVYAVPGGDKTGHAVLMGTLAFLVNLSFNDRRWHGIPLGPLLVFGLVAAEECSQLLIAHRTFDLGDLASDALGIALGAWLAARLLRRQHLQGQSDPQVG